MTSEKANPSPQALLAEITALRQQIAMLQREKADLDLLMEMTTEYSDDMTEELFSTVEETQREGEERFELITNIVPVPIIVSRQVDDTIIYANAAAANLTGMETMETLLGLKITRFYSDRKERDKILAEVMSHGFVNNWELQGNQHDDTLFWAVVFVRPLTFNNKPCWLEVYHDLTARKQAQAKILRLQYLLQNIADSMPSALITLNASGQVLTWNPAAQKLTGCTKAQVMGQELWQVCPYLDRFQPLFSQVMSRNQMVHQHSQQLSPNQYYDISIFPLADEIGGVVLRLDDVTRRVRLEEMMLQSAKMAGVGGLAAGIAHEINNPLSAMVQSAQMLQMALDTQRPRTRERLQTCRINPDDLNCYLQNHNLLTYIDGIRNTGTRAAKIVTDLLSFARKNPPAETAPQNLNELVEQALSLAATDYNLKKKFDFKDLEIVYELSPDLPPVPCDAQQIEQVVLNLVRNAAQALAEEREQQKKNDKPGSKKGRLIVRTSMPSDDYVRLEVEDNGPGISDEVKGRLFDPFFTTKAMGKGIGLGLWVCWSIVVERHQGRLLVEPVLALAEEKTVEGENIWGAKFIIELPVNKQSTDALPGVQL